MDTALIFAVEGVYPGLQSASAEIQQRKNLSEAKIVKRASVDRRNSQEKAQAEQLGHSDETTGHCQRQVAINASFFKGVTPRIQNREQL